MSMIILGCLWFIWSRLASWRWRWWAIRLERWPIFAGSESGRLDCAGRGLCCIFNLWTSVVISIYQFQLNLASQSVLEALNACLDHRGEVFIPELGRSFKVHTKTTRLFACQNPQRQGGARRGLPKSFLNRFTEARKLNFFHSIY